MNADAFRHLYGYHFAENRTLWDKYVTGLPQEQFTRPSTYSMGSVRNQLVHMMRVDNDWFNGLRGGDFEEMPAPEAFDDRETLRAKWDTVEQMMQGYLAALTDDMLTTKPFQDDEDGNLILWQVLLHVANHGTDHRAQILRLLNDMGVKTVSQDYIFYVYDHP
jgi:uncharacterized damage-inducible protein DinB